MPFLQSDHCCLSFSRGLQSLQTRCCLSNSFADRGDPAGGTPSWPFASTLTRSPVTATPEMLPIKQVLLTSSPADVCADANNVTGGGNIVAGQATQRRVVATGGAVLKRSNADARVQTGAADSKRATTDRRVSILINVAGKRTETDGGIVEASSVTKERPNTIGGVSNAEGVVRERRITGSCVVAAFCVV